MSRLFRPAELPGLETIEVDDQEALATTRRLIALGFPVGPSSGLNFAAAARVSRRLGPSARVVTVFPDRMERYFSTDLFRPMKG
jgi:cysteine synthase A